LISFSSTINNVNKSPNHISLRAAASAMPPYLIRGGLGDAALPNTQDFLSLNNVRPEKSSFNFL
jgi:hypothetical protein